MESDSPVPTSPSPASETHAAAATPVVHQRYSLMTLAVCAICVSVFLGLGSRPDRYAWAALEAWGCYSADRIRAGALWGFITSAFVHLELWHVAFNVYWLYVLGTRLERALGSAGCLAFVLSAAFLSSGAEFAFTDSTGVGASGVVYAIFGFMWVSKSRYPYFREVLEGRTVLWFVVWLLGCIAMTVTEVWEVGNSAHIAGLLFGAGIAAWVLWPKRRPLLRLGFVALCLLSLIPVFWAPWSIDWTSERGIRAYRRGDFRAAINWYRRSLSRGQDKTWCWQNIALAYFAAGDKGQYERTLELLRKLDPKASEEIQKRVSETEK